MVATRRGTRVSSSGKDIKDDAADTPVSTIRKTRQSSVIVTTQSQSEQTSDSQQDDGDKKNTAAAEPGSSLKRETRCSKCRSTDMQPESTHEADVSESESCSSVVSDIQPTPRSRTTTGRAKPSAVAEELTKAESSSSLVKTPRRSMRVQKKSVPVSESTTSQEDEQSESSSSVPSLFTRVMRSCRRPAEAPEDAANSEADSCSSVGSGPRGSKVRKSTRNRVKVLEPVVNQLEQSEIAEASDTFEPRRTRQCKARSAEEGQAYDSDGCQSGPSLSPRRIIHSGVADSDSLSTVYTSLDSPCSAQARGTPCSSRTGSASSSRAVRACRLKSVRVKMGVLKDVLSESVQEDSEENEPEKDQAQNAEDIPSMTINTTKTDVEEDANNKTIIPADQEIVLSNGTKGDLALTLNVDKADEVTPQSRQGSEAERDDKSRKEGSISGKPQKSDTGTEEDQSNIAEEPGTEVQQTSEPVEHGNFKVLSESEDKLEATNDMIAMETDESTIPVIQGPSEEDVREDMTNKAGPSSNSIESKINAEKTMKGCVSLLDSSEDEESGDEILIDGDNDEAGDSKNEDEPCCSGCFQDPLEEASLLPGSSRALDTLSGNGLFVIDARPGCLPAEKYYIDATQNEADVKLEVEEDFIDEEGGDDDDEDDEDSKVLFSTRKPALMELSSSIDPGLKIKALGGLYINFDGSKSKSITDNVKKMKAQKNQDELLQKSVIVADYEKKDTVPPYKESKHANKLRRREERSKTTGDGWFNMRAPELTEDLKNDLQALKMRSALDPKRFYKKNDREGLPKYFEVGTVVDNPIDFYHSRIPKKERKRTIVEELLADAEIRSYNKRKYREILSEKAAAAAGKQHKKKHKFHKKK